MCCDCWWINLCGVVCGGWHSALLCVSCWACKPGELQAYSPNCCECCTWTGIGGNFFCYGGVCCAPEALAMFSRGRRPGGQNVIIINR